MADAMIGFGIGLSGMPTDYTSIIAARERQKGMDEAKAKQAKAKEYEDVMKSLNVKEHLGYKKEEVALQLGETIKGIQKAVEDGDYQTKIMLLNKFQDNRRRDKEEWQSVQDIKEGIKQGKINPDIDISQVENAKTRDEIKNLQGSGLYFDDNTNTLKLNPIASLNLTNVYTSAALAAPLYDTGKKLTFTAADGTKTTRAELVADPKDVERNLAVAWGNTPGVAENAVIDYKRSKGMIGKSAEQMGMTPEQLQEEAFNQYIQNGLEYGQRQNLFTLKNKAGGINISQSVSTGTPSGDDFGDWAPADVELRYLNQSNQPSKGVLPSVWGITYSKNDVSMPNTTGYRDLNSGKKITFSAGDDIKFSAVELLPVYEKKYLNKEPGEIVLPYELNDPKIKNYIKYELTAVGQGTYTPIDFKTGKPQIDPNTGKPIQETGKVYRPFSEVWGSIDGKLTDKQRATWKNQKYPQALNLKKQKNDELKGASGGTPAATPTAAPVKKGGGKSNYDKYKEVK